MISVRYGAWRAWRRPLTVGAVAVVLAVVTAAFVVRLLGEARAARDAYGDRVEVVVAAVDLPAGAVVDAGAVTVEARPRAHVAADALRAPPTGERVRVAMAAGEVVLARRLAPAGTGAVAARLPPGTVGVGVPLPLPLPVEPGDRVDVIDALGVTGTPSGRDLLVVHVDGDVVTLAVPVDEAAAVATAGLATSAVPVLRAGSG